MFALLRNLKKLNQTNKLDSWAELGSGAEGQQEASGGMGPVREEWPSMFTLSPLIPGPGGLTHTTPKGILRSDNDLPEGPPTEPTPGRGIPRARAEAQHLQVDLDGDEMTFSGNDLTELETHHDLLLWGSTSLRGELELHQDQEEDIFQAQGYLPVFPPPARPPAQSSETSPPLQPLSPHMPKDPQDTQEAEGSGMAPPPPKGSSPSHTSL